MHLVVLLVVFLLGTGIAWAQSPIVWDGTTQYTTLVAAGITGTGVESDPYIIDDPNKFVAFGALAHNSTAYWKLNADIDLGGHDWPYAGAAPKTFKGHLDGNNKTVSNYTITPVSNKCNALFGTIQGSADNRAEVKNLTISHVTITQPDAVDLGSTTYTSAFVGNMAQYATITGVHVNSVTVSYTNLTGTNYIGALAATVQKNSTITNCSVTSPSVTVSVTNAGASFIGAAIGKFAGTSAEGVSTISGLTVSNPSVTINKVTVANSFIGGVIGQINTYSTVDNVNVTAPSLTYNNADNPNVALNLGSFVGGIFGVAAQETAVTGVTSTGTAQVIIGTEANKSTAEMQAIKAGFIGQCTTNVRLENWTIANTSVQVKGSLTTTASQLGGFVGYLASANNAPLIVKKIKITGNSAVTVTGGITIGSQLAGFAGQFANANSANATITIGGNDATNEGVSIAGTTIVSVGGDITAASHIGGFSGYFVGRSQTGALITAKNVSLGTTNITLSGNTSVGSYYAGLVGLVAQGCNLDRWSITSATITHSGNITAGSYLGSAIGSITAAASYPSSATNFTIGTASITTGTTTSNNVVGSKIGLMGQASTNVTIDTWSVTSSIVTVNGNLVTTGSQVGGFVGNAASAAGAPLSINHITITGNTASSVTGNVSIASPLGGFAGQIAPANATNNYINITNTEITGTTSVAISGNVASGSQIGGFAGYLLGRSQTENAIQSSDISIGTASVTIGGQITTGSYLGGLAGVVDKTTVRDWKVTTGSNLTFNGNITAASYIGGAFGNVTGAANYPSVISNIDLPDLDINFNCDLTNAVYVGGIAGQLVPIATTPNKIEHCAVSGKMHSTGTHTFVHNMTYAFGGILGYTKQTAANKSEVNQCISKVDFDFSSITLATKSGSNYNMYNNGFVIGGILGRIEAPSSLPEHVLYSGKIYAPYAAVGPIVGIFFKANGTTYVYDDYSGENVTITEDWTKRKTWYYSDYKIGLLPALLNQTARTRNYTKTPEVIDGISYLTVDDSTFTIQNEIDVIKKQSKTILGYTLNNSNTKTGIYPQFTTNDATYAPYYMYYMQGVNAGTYMEDEELAEMFVEEGISFVPVMERTGDDASGYTFTVNPGDIPVPTDPGISISYQWYESDKTTPLVGSNASISLTNDQIMAAGNGVYCLVTLTVDGHDPISCWLYGTNAIVVFVDGTRGVDNAVGSTLRGWTPETAVKTIDNANLLLKPVADGGTWDKNYVVVIGILNPGTDVAFRSKGTNPAALTGKWGGVDYNGVIKIVKTGETGVNNTSTTNGFHNYVKGDTKFEYLTFRANKNTDDNNFFDCHGNSVWFGKGLVMTNFRNLSQGHGNINADQNIPEFTVLLTASNLNEEDISTYTIRSKPQTLTIESGHYGRIMAGRFTQAFFNNGGNTSHTILGSAAHPVWAVINIDIDKDNPNEGTVKREQGSNQGVKTDAFTCDINCIVAGLTDGSMYGDYEINVHGGKVEYIVGGNQGNPAANGSKTFVQPGGKSGNWGQWPNASFFGRSIINVEQNADLKDITIGNLYAGGLGRDVQDGKDATVVDMYMYGQTEINMKSGIVTGNIYGGGAGGVIGLNPWDMHVPYATTDANNATDAIMNGVQYGTWGSMPAGSPLASVTLHNSDGNGGYTPAPLSLELSSTTLNLSGGTINGSIYGGGCGFVNGMPSGVTMQGVGSVFGTSNVNVSGGMIVGSVYGGSQGAKDYYGSTNNYGQTINHIAEMNGSVNLNVTGTDELWPTIGGNIYGGGAGIASTSTQEYLRIATTGDIDLGELYASTINITIDLPASHPFLGNVYGGGEMGAVDGTTNITINGGVLGQVVDGNVVNGNVFGGGKGESGHPDKAKVTGTTYVNIEADANDEVMGDVYGGGELAQVVGDTRVDINSGPVRGDVYGGGSLADIVGNTSVNLNGGKLHSTYGGGLGSKVGINGATTNVEAHVTGNTTVVLNGSVVLGEIFGCNNLNGTPQGHVFVDIKTTTSKGTESQEHPYHVAAVYGGGNLAAYVPTNANDYTEVLVENCDNSIEDVFGGGNAATVPNTEVTIWGGLINRVFAGGNGASSPADVTNNTHLILHGGTINEVYGGSNSQGTIGGTIIVDVEAEAFGENNLCPIAVTDLYGGGNMAASNAGRITIGCTGEGSIANVYGGANKADVTGDINLNITGGNIGNVFGGNNNSGAINGNITVNVDWNNTCGSNALGNVYGGGHLAPYGTNETPRNPVVYVRNATITGDVFGGGLGGTAIVTGNPQVNIDTDCPDGEHSYNHQVTINGSVYGGGSAASVVGDPVVTTRGMDGDTKKVLIKNHVFGGGLGNTAQTDGSTTVNIYGNTEVEKNVYGGGNGGVVGGNTQVTIGESCTIAP